MESRKFITRVSVLAGTPILFIVAARSAAGAAVLTPAQIHAMAIAQQHERQRELRLEHSPAVKVLNPYYIRIATAVVTHDQKSLAKYAAAMHKFAADRSRPYLRFPATRAEVFCLARLDSEDSFIHAFARFCRVGRTTLRAPRATAFANIVFAWLSNHKKSAWVSRAVAAGLPASGPGPDKLYMYLLNLDLAEMKSPLTKAKVINRAIAAAHAAIVRAEQIHQPKAVPGARPGTRPLALGGPPRLGQYKRALETLRYDRVVNAALGLSVHELCRAAQIYLANYGAHGKYSQQVFYQTLNSLYLVQKVVPNVSLKQHMMAEGRWLAGWYPRIIKTHGPFRSAINLRWAQWKKAGG